MKNKTNEANNYECVLCETGEGKTHGALCSENKNNLTEEDKRLLRTLLESKMEEIENFEDENSSLLIEYKNILQKL